ncbi:MAG: hypothetical protein CM15mV10_1180 [uncultured marine virus]|nr:MAG: hypothetical protein CM15mV10_1180 [uncultured marine virus]
MRSEKVKHVSKQSVQQKELGDWLGLALVLLLLLVFPLFPLLVGVAAGWVAMFGGDQGADIGGNMAEDLNKNC